MYNVTENINSTYRRNPVPTAEAVVRTKGTFFGMTYDVEGKQKTGLFLTKGNPSVNPKVLVVYNVKTGNFEAINKENVHSMRANGVLINFKA